MSQSVTFLFPTTGLIENTKDIMDSPYSYDVMWCGSCGSCSGVKIQNLSSCKQFKS